MLHLVHDVLDAQLTDCCHEKVGRADELVLDVSQGAPPRLNAILIGGDVRARRIGAWAIGLRHMFRRMGLPHGTGVSRVPFSAVREIGDCVELDVDESDLASERLERWLRHSVVCRIPGAKGERK